MRTQFTHSLHPLLCGTAFISLTVPITADVALFCTHSDVRGMKATAAKFAPVVIDVYGDLIAMDPEAYDETARRLRTVA